MRILVCILSFILIAIQSFSQTHTPKTVSITSNCKGYYEYLPIDYANSGKQYPLLIYCAGAASFGSGTTSQLSKLLAEGPAYYINNNQFPKTFTTATEVTSFIVISPQFVAWPSPTDVEGVLNYVLSNGYRVDQSRIYLAGFSAGGDVTWKYPNTGLLRAKKLAALVPVAGYNYPYVDSGAKYISAANLPVWALHSTSDQTAPYTWSQNFVNKINSFNPAIRAKLTLVSGVAHDPSKTYFYNPTFRDGGYNVYEWMLLYRRNYPPIAKAGNDVNLSLPANFTTLNGTASSDPENSPLTYLWTKISGPSLYTINNSSSSTPSISNLVAGIYSFELTVTDSDGYTGKDTVKITVINPNPNVLPVANAGNDISILLPQTSVTLNGSSSYDVGGSIESFAWTQVSGPVQISIANSSTPTINNLKKGTYLFKLTVTDNEGGTDADTVQLTVINPFPNKPPVSDAGVNQTITLPTNSTTLNGSLSSDSDGFIVGYLWTQVAGPSTATVTTPNAAITSVANLVQGTYKFELKVTDDSSAVGKDTVQVIVFPAPTINNRYVRVNLYGGTNPYNQDGWNNWNVTGSTNITSSNFNYSDGGTSSINAVLSYTQGIGDNGASYGGTMCPAPVLRYATYSTASTRSLTIKGLNNALTYDLEFYASRANTGNSTAIVVNGTSQTVVTDNNKSNSIAFVSVKPSNGQIVVSVNKASGTYSYLNGFTLIEKTVVQNTGAVPVADAGGDVILQLPVNSVQLDGSNSSDTDGNIVGYSWSKVSGPASFTIGSPALSTTAVTNLTAGIYKFELTVTDNSGATGKDTVQITVNEIVQPGTTDSLNCGRAYTIVMLGSSTTYGTGATPIDSSWVNRYSDYAHNKNVQTNIINLGVPSVTSYEVLRPTGYVPPANRPAPDTLHNISKALKYRPDAIIINLPSNDIAMGYSQQEIKDNYERAMAIADSVQIPVWVTTTQPRNTLSPTERTYQMQLRDWTYQRFGNKAIDFWSTVANSDGTINSLYSAGDGVHVNNAGHYLFYIRAMGERILDSLCLRKNLKPVAKAGNDVVLTLPQDSVQLNGAGSFDTDGSIASYSWTMISGPAQFSLNTLTSSSPKIKGLVAGNYLFELTVTDNLGAIGKDTVQVTVNAAGPQSPVANAGNDRLIHLPSNSVQLNANNSYDPDGTIASYLWNKVSGPASFSINDNTLTNPVISNLDNGIYLVELIVTDSDGLTSKDTVSVKVNKPPIANGGADNSITLPVNSVQLDGSNSSDQDGSLTSYQWNKIVGPSQFSISNSSVAKPTVSNLVQGIYQFELVVTDNDGGSAKDTVIITVYRALNKAPLANAGADQSITLPANSVTVSGSSSSDTDGSIVSYQWSQVSGPSSATINSPLSVSTQINNLVQGIYLFEIKVTDDSSAVGKDTVQITVLPQPTTTSKFIRVNLYGGSNPYTTGNWNNWTIGTGERTNTISSNFIYDDASVSTVSATLSFSSGIADNGASFGGTMCPPQVLRYTSYSTSTRTLVVRGLNNGYKYDIEFYASRANTGNSTQFTINGLSKTVVTDNNLANKVIYTDLTPTNGQITVTLSRVGTYNYLNGFTLTEKAQLASPMMIREQLITQTTPENKVVANIFPNPYSSQVQLNLSNSFKGNMSIQVFDLNGKLLKQFEFVKTTENFSKTLMLPDLRKGNYILKIRTGKTVYTHKLVKIK